MSSKRMMFASKITTNRETDNLYFGLPDNPVSAFVMFHLFVLPALRYSCGWDLAKCTLAEITVEVRKKFMK
jgi:molybdopterin biosynthesis enzyme